MAEFEPIREVRFGLVLYGGVSLAVYINGVVQELFSLVRATTPKLDAAEEPLDELLLPDHELRDAEPVYRQLGRMYGDPAVSGQTEGPVRTRFVIDIISGSSAGGINGVYLAKALANQQNFAALRDLWVEKAGVAGLLNDRKSRKPRADRLTEKEPPEALFSGDIMYLELLEALDSMDRPTPGQGPTDAPPSPYVRDLDLWITATDLEGTALPLRLSDDTILEKSHRHTFHFVFGEAQAVGNRRNDFAASVNPMLAFAARATSAFPFAFVPARLTDISRVLRVDGSTKAPGDPKDNRWRPWFRKQLQVTDFDYENVSFGDGGDMDNKPFGWVIDTLPSRTSSAPVDRRLLYVEPDPGDPTILSTRAAARPDVIGSSIAAFSLGRVENIRDDIERLAKMSAVRERIGVATAAVDERFRTDPAKKTPTTDEWLAETPEQMVARGLPYAAYLRLRVETLMTEFARALVGLPWHAAETPESAAMRALVAQWVQATYADPYAPSAGKQSTKHLLVEFDIAFRIRRLGYVAKQADQMHRSFDASTAEKRLEAAQPTAPDDLSDRFRAEARRIKAALGSAERWLRLWVPSARSNPESKPDDFVLSPEEVTAFVKAPQTWPVRAWQARGPELVDVAGKISTFLTSYVFVEEITRTTAAFTATTGGQPEAVAREQIQVAYDRFADYDEVTFPLHAASGITGEVDPVLVHRISPRDAKGLVDPASKAKVAGARLGHFGGFLDADWRANDIMWGRLDTAERLLRCLVPEGEGTDEMVLEAHDAILRAEWYKKDRRGADHVNNPLATTLDDKAARNWRIDTFKGTYKPPPWPPTVELMGVASRASQVTSSMLEGVADRPGVKILHRVVAAVAWVLTAVTTVVFPGGLRRTPVRYLSALTVGVGVVLATVGTLLNWDAASSTGRPLIAGGLAALTAVLLVRLGSRNAKRAVVWTLIAVLLALASYGGWRLWDEYRPRSTPRAATTTQSME